MKRNWKIMFIELLYVFLVGRILCASSISFNEAPGTIMLKIGIPDFIDSCATEDCRFTFEYCIGSGRSQNERCTWIPTKIYSGSYKEHTKALNEQFQVDNIRESFYFNANFTFNTSNKVSQTLLFQDNLCQYSTNYDVTRLSLHSQNYVSLGIEIDVKCKENYYPIFQCTKWCLEESNVNSCDNNGSKICFEGYALISSIDRCVKDLCKSSGNMCENNSTCLNGLNSVTCLCRPNYAGTLCDTWDPCIGHKCQNSGICVKRVRWKDYECRCGRNYYGQYCQEVRDPCAARNCPPTTNCKRIGAEAVCEESSKPGSKSYIKRYFSTSRTSTTQVAIKSRKVGPEKINESGENIRETVKLVQNPAPKDFTTMAIIVVLLVVMICGFGGTFWIQRFKYLQKNKKSIANQAFLSKLSIMHLPPYYPSKRWHSVDGATLKDIHQAQNYGYQTLYCNSGLSPRGAIENHYGTSRNSFMNWQPSLIARIPMTNRSSVNDENIEPNNKESVTHQTPQ